MTETWVERLLRRVLPHENIPREGEVYLRQHHLVPKWLPFRVCLHLIKRQDMDRDSHDHPWWFWTLVLSRGYLEAIYERGRLLRYRVVGRFGRRMLFRGAEFQHRIVTLFGNRPCWTLVVRPAKSRRKWGFWTPDGKFIPHDEYARKESF